MSIRELIGISILFSVAIIIISSLLFVFFKGGYLVLNSFFSKIKTIFEKSPKNYLLSKQQIKKIIQNKILEISRSNLYKKFKKKKTFSKKIKIFSYKSLSFFQKSRILGSICLVLTMIIAFILNLLGSQNLSSIIKNTQFESHFNAITSISFFIFIFLLILSLVYNIDTELSETEKLKYQLYKIIQKKENLDTEINKAITIIQSSNLSKFEAEKLYGKTAVMIAIISELYQEK